MTSLAAVIGSLFLAAPVTAAASFAAPAADATAGVPPRDAGWALVWSDEFDGRALDRTKWAPEESCWGGGNNERQCYTGRRANVQVKGGTLRLIARPERFTGPEFPPEFNQPGRTKTQDYTSGKVRTLGIAAFRYGRIEVRARLPKGQGTWPAMWLMPETSDYGPWPRSGEIDLIEAVNIGAACDVCGPAEGNGREARSLSALHFGPRAPGNLHIAQRVAPDPKGKGLGDAYHVWTLEWAEDRMRFYLDGRLYWDLTGKDWAGRALPGQPPQAPFDRPFYLMANLAFGGKLAEENNARGIDPKVLPAELRIDWIRVYQCAPDRARGLACLR
jgi:beta-glucanase (GH16 family)